MMLTEFELESIILNDYYKAKTTDIIYQYSTYNVALTEIILKQSLRFSDPLAFNDPFDCNEKLLQIKYDKDLIQETLLNLKVRPSRQKRREIHRKFKDLKNQQEILKIKRKEYKLSCFSENCNSILMWSHYADKHSGICIGFDFPPVYKDKFILCPVKYINVLKPFEGTINVLKVVLYWLTTKSIFWQHENEIRAITKSKDNNAIYEFINFDNSYIKEIIFGCNVSEDKINDALKHIKQSNLNFPAITIKQMRIDENNFSLKEKIIKSAY